MITKSTHKRHLQMEFENLILSALKTKFEGIDAKILGRIAKKHAKTATGTTEEDAKTIVDGITLQQVLDSYADYRATEATKTAVQNYETKHKLRDGKPIETPETNPTPPPSTAPQGSAGKQDETPDWAKTIIEDNRVLRAELESFKKEKTTSSRLAKFEKAIEALPGKFKERYKKDFSRLAFKDDEDFDNYLLEIAPDIAELAEQESRAGAKVTQPLGGKGNQKEASPLVKTRFEAISKAADATPAIAGLPQVTQ